MPASTPSTLQEINQRRGELDDQMRAIVDKAKAESRGMTAEEDQQSKALFDEDTQLRDRRTLMEREAELESRRRERKQERDHGIPRHWPLRNRFAFRPKDVRGDSARESTHGPRLTDFPLATDLTLLAREIGFVLVNEIVWSKDATGGKWGSYGVQRPIFGSYP